MIANNKPVIEDIPQDKQEAAQKFQDSKSTYGMKHTRLNDLTGICCCGRIPSKVIKYDVSDDDGPGVLIERYCPKCFERWLILEGKDKKVKLLDTGQRNETIAVVEKNA